MASVNEAMGESGIIPESYIEPLNALKTRLLLNDDAANRIKNTALADFLAPMCKDLSTKLEKREKEQREAAKKGEDISKSIEETDFMDDCLSVVEFLKQNGLAKEIPDGVEEVVTKKMVKKTLYREKKVMPEEIAKPEGLDWTGGDEKKEEPKSEPKTEMEAYEEEVEEEERTEVPKFKYEFPVTAQSIFAISDEAAEALYKAFVIGAFSAKEPMADRYSKEAAYFGLSMGLEEKEMDQIKGGIGATVFDNYFSTAMKDKVELDQQDFMFLTQIQEKLGFSEEIVERLLVSTQKNMLSKEVERLFSSGTKILPDSVKAVVEKAAGMGIDLSKDLGVDMDRLGRMFTIQIQGGIESGHISGLKDGGSDAITEIVEGLGIEEEFAEKKLEYIIKDRAKRMITNIASDVSRGNDERALNDISVFLRYAGFVDGEGLDLNIAPNVRDKIVSVYEASVFGQEESVQMVELLSTSLK